MKKVLSVLFLIFLFCLQAKSQFFYHLKDSCLCYTTGERMIIKSPYSCVGVQDNVISISDDLLLKMKKMLCTSREYNKEERKATYYEQTNYGLIKCLVVDFADETITYMERFKGEFVCNYVFFIDVEETNRRNKK